MASLPEIIIPEHWWRTMELMSSMVNSRVTSTVSQMQVVINKPRNNLNDQLKSMIEHKLVDRERIEGSHGGAYLYHLTNYGYEQLALYSSAKESLAEVSKFHSNRFFKVAA